MQANFAILPSVVLVTMGSSPTVNSSAVDNQDFVFPWKCCVRVSDGPHEHGSCAANTTFRSACIATDIFASTSFGRERHRHAACTDAECLDHTLPTALTTMRSEVERAQPLS